MDKDISSGVFMRKLWGILLGLKLDPMPLSYIIWLQTLRNKIGQQTMVYLERGP